MEQKRILCLFDVDGTLTQPRQVISEDLRIFLLEKLKPEVSLGLVSGSDYVKVLEQVGGEDVASQFDYMFCENGLVQYRKGLMKSKESLLNHLGEEHLQRLINYALGYMSKIKLPAKRGNFIEFRTSMINICPVGRSCSQLEREQFAQYDAEHKIRQTFVQALKSEFTDLDLSFAIGGQISIDVYPTGWDKTYCLGHLEDEKFDEIHFFGDKTEPGGNDHEIYHDPRTVGHRVNSPFDTRHQLENLFTK